MVGEALPLGQDVGWHIDIFPQFLERMAAQEEAIEICLGAWDRFLAGGSDVVLPAE